MHLQQNILSENMLTSVSLEYQSVSNDTSISHSYSTPGIVYNPKDANAEHAMQGLAATSRTCVHSVLHQCTG